MESFTIPSVQFVERFKRKAREFQNGEQLLQRLEQNSCGLDLILSVLEIHCGARVTSAIQEEIKDKIGKQRTLAKRLASIAKSLQKIAPEIEKVNNEVKQQLARWPPRPCSLLDEIRLYGSRLATISTELRGMSLRTVPMEALNFLAGCITKSSNGVIQADEADLGLLLEVGFAAFGTTQTVGNDTIRLALKRVRERKKNKS